MDSPSDDHRAPANLYAALRALTTALDEPATDLDEHLSTVHEHLTGAVPSLLSASLTVIVDGFDFSLTAPPRADTSALAGSSLLIPLAGTTLDPTTTAHLLLRASTPGSLVDFAADSAHLLGIDLAALDVDNHLHGAPPDPESSLDERAVIDYAVGILYESNALGSIAAARAVLHQLADRDQVTMYTAAARIVADVNAQPPGPAADTR
ncbi:ANTAR domain-containing protein [Williamsia soli]|uniref:ANTAR domain-containing protein n=1 Tax=Williamsia soli TaxID=364929 RepID=UPI001A9CF263|nr:ANTAR domain-containing protein [Williamsia soli]